MSASLTGSPLLGTLLAGRYEVRAPLGTGGMGEVFEAVDRRLGRTVAIKVLRPELTADERFLTRFRREARTAAGLAHMGIVSVHDIGDDAGRTFIVMEFVAGRTLAELAVVGAPLDLRRLAQIGAAAARALAHAHDRGVLHRDVSPANVMVTVDGTVKILDFGIARGHDDQLGSAAASRGTVDYLAPEVLRGQPIDARADVYALGVVLRELAREIDGRHEGLDAVLDRASAPDTRARFVSATAFADALDRLAGDPAQVPGRGPERARRTADQTAPIVRMATRPLGSAVPPRPLEGVPQVAIARTREVTATLAPPRSRGRRIARTLVILALGAGVLGAAVVLGQVVGSVASPQATTAVPPAPVPAPAELVASASCDGLFSTGVDLTWEGRAPVKGYEIWRGDRTGERELVTRVRGVHTTAFRDADLGVDATYSYRVRAFVGPRVSEWSNVAEVSTPFLCLT